MVNINVELDEGKVWLSVGVNKGSISALHAQEDVRLEIAGLGCLNTGLLRMRSGSLIGREK